MRTVAQTGRAGSSLMMRGVITAISAGLLLGLLGRLVFVFDPWIKGQEQWAYLTLLNTLPLLVPMLFVAIFFRRVWPSAIVVGYATWLLFVINSIKLAELGQPLLFTDILLLTQVIGNAPMLGLYTDPGLLIGVTLGAVFLVGLTTLVESPKGGWRGSLGFLCLTGLFAALLASAPVNRVLSERGAMDTPWSPIESVENTGLIASVAASAGRDVVAVPKPDSRLLAETLQSDALASDTRPQALASSQRPDIVMVLSESFFDLDILKGVDSCAYLPAWCSLKASAISGQMSVPTFGGNTTRTEFEVLTGVPYALLPPGVYPYTSIVRKPMASLPHWLGLLGYETTAIHPHKRTFWQRHRAYPLLGFQSFISEENMSGYTRKGWFISDQDMTDLIINQLNEATDRPQFIFAISMENHGPWSKPRPNLDPQRLASLPGPPGLDEKSLLTWRQYVYHAQNAMSEVMRLKSFLDERDRPSLIVFFGDHLPGLSPVYDALGFENGLEVLAQQTPYLILSDSAPDSFEWSVDSAFQLPVKVLQASGLPTPQSYRALASAYAAREDALPEGGRTALQLSLLQQDAADLEDELVIGTDPP